MLRYFGSLMMPAVNVDKPLTFTALERGHLVAGLNMYIKSVERRCATEPNLDVVRLWRGSVAEAQALLSKVQS